jgi:hypothetical protein
MCACDCNKVESSWLVAASGIGGLCSLETHAVSCARMAALKWCGNFLFEINFSNLHQAVSGDLSLVNVCALKHVVVCFSGNIARWACG